MTGLLYSDIPASSTLKQSNELVRSTCTQPESFQERLHARCRCSSGISNPHRPSSHKLKLWQQTVPIVARILTLLAPVLGLPTMRTGAESREFMTVIQLEAGHL